MFDDPRECDPYVHPRYPHVSVATVIDDERVREHALPDQITLWYQINTLLEHFKIGLSVFEQYCALPSLSRNLSLSPINIGTPYFVLIQLFLLLT